MRPWCIYWWHAPFHDFVKVGYSFDPPGRMEKYAKKYKIVPDPSSLRRIEMRSEIAAIYAEERLHLLLPEYGLQNFPWDATSGFGESREFFDIAPNDFSAIDWLLGDLLGQVMSTMPSDEQIAARRKALARERLAKIVEREATRKLSDDIPF